MGGCLNARRIWSSTPQIRIFWIFRIFRRFFMSIKVLGTCTDSQSMLQICLSIFLVYHKMADPWSLRLNPTYIIFAFLLSHLR